MNEVQVLQKQIEILESQNRELKTELIRIRAKLETYQDILNGIITELCDA